MSGLHIFWESAREAEIVTLTVFWGNIHWPGKITDSSLIWNTHNERISNRSFRGGSACSGITTRMIYSVYTSSTLAKEKMAAKHLDSI